MPLEMRAGGAPRQGTSMGSEAKAEPPPSRRDEVLLVDFDAGEHGHRGQYNAMLARLFHLRRERFSFSLLLARAPVLCPQIEAAPARFALTAMLRAMLGRRTVGLLLRPLPALEGRSLRLRIKRLVLHTLRRAPGVQVLTIVPFSIHSGLASIAHGWIHDLQGWDMQLEVASGVMPRHHALTETIRKAARGRAVCCAIGRQNRDKGFDRFAALHAADRDLRETMLFAFGGEVSPELGSVASAFAQQGGFALDRLVSDDELFALYAAADLVWCFYSPEYDQASGVLGRAMQLGIPVVTRARSVVAAICEAEGHPFLALDDDRWQPLAHPPRRVDPDLACKRAREHGIASLERLAAALGVQPAWDPFARRTKPPAA